MGHEKPPRSRHGLSGLSREVSATMRDFPQKSIGILLIDGFALLSYASVIEPMRAANLLAKRPIYQIRHLSQKPSARSSSGARVDCEAMEQIDPATLKLDMLFVIAGGDPSRFNDKDTLGFLRRLGRSPVKLVGVSGGPVILAHAGVMNGYNMTVHWEHAAQLSQDLPDLMLKRTLFVMDRNRLSCAGGTAPLDLMHALIAQDCGGAFALEVSDWFMHTDIRPDIGAQRSGLIERYRTRNRAVLQAIAAMETHISDPLTQTQLSHFSGVSDRQLNRLFLKEIGETPMKFYRDMRLDHAAKFLQQSAMSITEIALATGFYSAAHFTSKFTEKFGVNPRDYNANDINPQSDMKSPQGNE